MRNAGLGETQAGIKIAGRNINIRAFLSSQTEMLYQTLHSPIPQHLTAMFILSVSTNLTILSTSYKY